MIKIEEKELLEEHYRKEIIFTYWWY